MRHFESRYDRPQPGGTMLNLTYEYGTAAGNDGRIKKINDLVVPDRTVHFEYDGLSRLQRAHTTGGATYPAWELTWSYSAAGNREEQTADIGNPPATSLAFDPATNRVTSTGWAHDASGNVIVFIAWKPDGFIPECRGFALMRRRNGIEETVSTWVGFEGQSHQEGERRASTNWPIQKYQWTDYMANPGDKVQYRVLPMVGPDKDNLRPDPTTSSDWTKEITLTHEFDPQIEAYFNRGIVAAQWISRRLGITAEDLKSKKLRIVIETPNDPLRRYLHAPLGSRLFEVLADSAKSKRHIYAALYELDDEQLEAAPKHLASGLTSC